MGGGHQLFLTDTVFEFSDVVTWWLTTRHYIYHLFCTLIFVIINTLRKRNELLFCVLLFRTEPSDLSINLQKSPIRTFFLRACKSSEDSDQTAHPRILIKVLASGINVTQEPEKR